MINSRTKQANIVKHMIVGLLLLSPIFQWVNAQQVTIAVAANFQSSLVQLKQAFEAGSSHRVTIVAGSTGKLYAQIKQGAPFDIFMAADKQRPQLLEKNGVGITGSRFTYAFGQLVLWAGEKINLKSLSLKQVLSDLNVKHIVIANPKLAPYGLASMQTLESLGLNDLSEKLIYAENINSVFHFVSSKTVDLGFVSLSQIRGQLIDQSDYRQVPQNLHQGIEQQAILLNATVASRAFYQFLKSPQAVKLIKNMGYLTEQNRFSGAGNNAD